MRNQLLKLTTGKSTKSERIFSEILKELRIPFKTKVRILGKELDFVVGKYTIEINGHEQVPEKNNSLIQFGYVPIHFHNLEIINNRNQIKNKLCQLLELN